MSETKETIECLMCPKKFIEYDRYEISNHYFNQHRTSLIMMSDDEIKESFIK